MSLNSFKSVSSSSKISSRRSSSSSSSSNGKQPNHFLAQGDNFVDLVKETPYKTLLKVKTEYELNLVKSQLHWLLLVRMKDSDEAYISLEITTSNMTDLLQTMRIYEQESDPTNLLKATPVANYETKLIDLCETADRVVRQMGTYSLISRNCQHFCNTLLTQLGIETDNYHTTVGPNYLPTAEENFDNLPVDPTPQRSIFAMIYGTAMAKILYQVGMLAPIFQDTDSTNERQIVSRQVT